MLLKNVHFLQDFFQQVTFLVLPLEQAIKIDHIMKLLTVHWNFQNMKYFIILIVCIASGVTAQKFNRNCSTLVAAKAPTAPKVGMWYLVAREKKVDAFKCYNIKISVKTGTTLTIVASLMADKYVLNNTFDAVPNKNGAWDITTTNGLDNNVFYFKLYYS